MEITDPPAQGIEPEGQQQVDPLLPGGDDLGMEPHELRDDIDEEGDVRMDEISAALEAGLVPMTSTMSSWIRKPLSCLLLRRETQNKNLLWTAEA